MKIITTGNLSSKMGTAFPSSAEEVIQYTLRTAQGAEIALNPYIGKAIQLDFTGKINCKRCGRLTKKSFSQGFCYPCFNEAPENSPCIIKPELCEAHEGKGRDPEWEERNHNQAHVVYLALTNIVKVGVTRSTQVPYRWVDQGAWKVIKLCETPYRRLAGEIEVALKEHFTDKTDWRKMLRNVRDENVDLEEVKEEAIEYLDEGYHEFISDEDDIYEMNFPVNTYPVKVKSLNFDKSPSISGVLNGIKGQYLLLDQDRVINLRKFAGYEISFIA